MTSKEKTTSKEFKGLYGSYTIDKVDEIEVRRYRLSLLFCGVFLAMGIIHLSLFGSDFVGIWLVLLAISIGLSLNWIHIYLKQLHMLLILLWAAGFIGICILISLFGIKELIPNLGERPILIFLIGPLFASLTGVGFKEFFCFQKPEAIGMTILIPLSLLGYLSGLSGTFISLFLMAMSAISLLFLAIRKFGTEVSADVGDKSIFNYLKLQSGR